MRLMRRLHLLPPHLVPAAEQTASRKTAWARGGMAMKPVFPREDSSAIPPRAPTGRFRHSLLTQRFFALARFLGRTGAKKQFVYFEGYV